MNPGAAPLRDFDVMSSVAHELRQPLSSIDSIAYYLALVLPKTDARLHEQLLRIQELIEQSHWIISNGVRLAGREESAAGNVDLEEMVTQLVSAAPGHFKLELSGDLHPVRLDADQARALVQSLLMIFRNIATAAHPVTVRTCGNAGAALELCCGAPGYRSENALAPGASLGIEVARRIAESQGGALEIAVTADSVRARVRLA